MTGFAINPGSTFLAPLMYGRHAPNSNVHPAVELVVNQKIGNEHLARIDDATRLALIGQKAVLEYHRQQLGLSSEQLRATMDLRSDVRAGFDRVAEGQAHAQQSLDRIGWLVTDGFEAIQGSMENINGNIITLNENTLQGFQTLGEYMRTGFMGVIDCMAESTKETHDVIRGGVALLARQQAQIGEILDSRLVQAIGVTVAGHMLTAEKLDKIDGRIAALLREQYSLRVDVGNGLNELRAGIHDDMTQFRVEVCGDLKYISDKLDALADGQRNKSRLEAQEHFGVGLKFFNDLRFDSAQRNFRRALDAWEGHFFAHLVSSHICYIRGQKAECENFLRDALAIGRGNPRHVSITQFYLGRLMMEYRNKDKYREAKDLFAAASRERGGYLPADVERLAAELLVKGDMPGNFIHFSSTVTSHFSERNVDVIDIWYRLALIAVGHNNVLAFKLAEHALSVDPAAIQRDRRKVVIRIKRLDSTKYKALLAILEASFSWMRKPRS